MTAAIALFHSDARKQRRRDPSGTLDIQREMRKDLDRRIAQIKHYVRAGLVDGDMLGLQGGGVWSMVIGPGTKGKIDAFARYFASANQTLVLGHDGSWLRPYIAVTYNRAVQRIATKYQQPIKSNMDRIEAISGLAAHELNGITDAGEQQAVRSIGQGLQNGHSAPVISREVIQRIDAIELARIRTLIATTIVGTNAIAQLDAYRQLGVTRVAKDVEWNPQFKHVHHDAPRDGPDLELVTILTAGDDLVCDDCQDLEGITYDIEEAQSIIPVHPNCRCAWIPAQDARFGEVPLQGEEEL